MTSELKRNETHVILSLAFNETAEKPPDCGEHRRHGFGWITH